MSSADLFEQKHSLAAVIDHTLLKPEATARDIERLCEEALIYGFASVCVNPVWVALASERLREAPVKVCTVCGFPLGATATKIKAAEAALARQQGAEEIDMVINLGALLSKDDRAVARDLAEVAEVARSNGGLLKVIIECCLLSDEEKKRACLLAVGSGADFVKTSTGFSKAGATVEDVRLMRETVGANVGVKASGGIRSLADARRMLEAGATRLGTSAGVNIIDGLTGSSTGVQASAY